MPTHYKETPEFQKDFKKILRRYRTLPEDLENFKKRMLAVDVRQNKNFVVLRRKNSMQVVKARFFCRSLKRNTLRIIYAQCFKPGEADYVDINFIEIYFKGDKQCEDQERIKEYLKEI